jgi:L-fuconolactonase
VSTEISLIAFDSHAHIISDDHARYRPAPLSGTLKPGDLDNPVTAEKLLNFMDENGVERALVVQRAHIYGFDNDYVVDCAQRHPDRLRAMCMVDALDPNVAQQIRHWVDRGAIAVRLTEPHKGADTSWFASPQAMAAWETAAQLGISLRLHLYRWNRGSCLPVLKALVERFSGVTVVVDHLSNLPAEEGPPNHGVDDSLRALAALPNLYLLFSTINLGPLSVKKIPAGPVLAHLVKEFGANRIMWGSDIAQSPGTYAQMRALADAAVATLTREEQRQVMHESGTAVYWR